MSGAPRVRSCAGGGDRNGNGGRVCLSWLSILQLGTVHRRELLNMSLLPLYLLGLLLSGGQGRSAAALLNFFFLLISIFTYAVRSVKLTEKKRRKKF